MQRKTLEAYDPKSGPASTTQCSNSIDGADEDGPVPRACPKSGPVPRMGLSRDAKLIDLRGVH